MPAGLGLVGRLVFGITRPRKPVLGTDLSGVVEAIGADVTTFQPGDAVIGFPGAGFGAHAEYITMPADGKVVRKPETLNFEEAAAIPFGATTAYDFLINKGKLRAGERVLIKRGVWICRLRLRTTRQALRGRSDGHLQRHKWRSRA
jgi:NADPH:quinone reductase-like Zn-dependent oxidoreductase